MYASRNISLCTKDCLCLFICPTGATDTENGQIDKTQCIDGCRMCVDACPSHAISLVFEEYPEPKAKDTQLVGSMLSFLEKKSSLEALAAGLAESSSDPGAQKLAKALQRSFRILGEDCAREGGFMLPQCNPVRDLKKDLDIIDIEE
ncbi:MULTISPECIES: 4Fe-4S ferredoxin [unclassified Oceanispirochaeta]|uniref:4Fe-4S ferredoxin n=1 Tax=unclassified Oceanispirochaeta TaxID=2635722 RepID=UPI000E0922B9|nr:MULTISPECIES: 4Fe-4S ferredoxin [unclassified Oceanispirochaeta]MBF9016269.1 4Fe-4S ferredoxin [Oceanispirochaeta sp. M2]NPD72731.1 4Fe-4S ferredoxin [Oceanispirochaeta sp. M1]RDG31578.1 4Fe-4S ferredoxin [Oceanispirochaeta sp. M1]